MEMCLYADAVMELRYTSCLHLWIYYIHKYLIWIQELGENTIPYCSVPHTVSVAGKQQIEKECDHPESADAFKTTVASQLLLHLNPGGKRC